jgi:hypothetical protein
MTTNIPLFLYLKFKGDIPKFVINPAPISVEQDTYKFNINPDSVVNLTITVDNITVNSALIIDKIILGGELLTHLDTFSTYRTKNGVKKTHGYMDEPGTYRFKIRYNALSQNYLNFLLTTK